MLRTYSTYGLVDCVVEGNLIGTDASGTLALPNTNVGLRVSPSLPIGFAPMSGVVIGGNVISGNALGGLSIENGVYNLTASSNTIGTNLAGTAAIPNGGGGVSVSGDIHDVVIGTGNLISGNAGNGVTLMSLNTSQPLVNNVVSGNLIGTNQMGTAAIGNGMIGVDVSGQGARNNRVVGNVVSGNGYSGVSLAGGTQDDVVVGNKIGTDEAGFGAVPNTGHGVFVTGAATSGITISGNLLSGNTGDGLRIESGAHHLTASGNKIGTDVAGTAARRNGGNGVGVATGAHDITIDDNVVSSNRVSGVWITSAHDVTLTRNRIGTDTAAVLRLPNSENGVTLDSSTDNVIGGVGAGNVVAANGRQGVGLYRSDAAQGSDRNVMVGNWIGTNSSGASGLGNGGYGVFLTGGSMNRFGGSGAGEGNTIAFNTKAGIGLASTPDTIGNRFWMNSIFDNEELGIDLGNDGVTPNDVRDLDAGPNDLLQPPGDDRGRGTRRRHDRHWHGRHTTGNRRDRVLRERRVRSVRLWRGSCSSTELPSPRRAGGDALHGGLGGRIPRRGADGDDVDYFADEGDVRVLGAPPGWPDDDHRRHIRSGWYVLSAVQHRGRSRPVPCRQGGRSVHHPRWQQLPIDIYRSTICSRAPYAGR